MLFLPTTRPNSPSGMTQSWLTTSQYDTSYLDSWNDTCLASHGSSDTLSSQWMTSLSDLPLEVSEDLGWFARRLGKGDVQLRDFAPIDTACVLDIGCDGPSFPLQTGTISMGLGITMAQLTSLSRRHLSGFHCRPSRPSNMLRPAYLSSLPLRHRSQQYSNWYN